MKSKTEKQNVIKPYMRIYMVESIRAKGGDQKTLQIFIKSFAEKKTGLIKISKLISAMKALGYYRYTHLVQKLLAAYTTKPQGFITTQNLMKILERQHRYDLKSLSNAQVEQIFLSFAKNGKLGLHQLQKAYLQLGIQSTAEQRQKMIKYFARNGAALDKFDFVQLING